jgi:hypothetical protein
MVYKFDPSYWNGTIFHLDEDTWDLSGDWDEYLCENQPIPASCFPKTLTFDGAKAVLPDVFHTSRDIIVFSERAREVMEQWAPGQVEFIPVGCRAEPKIAARLKFASAYYFTNVLGRAQRLQWLEMPTRKFPTLEDGTEQYSMLPDFSHWQLRERAANEPLVWHDSAWLVEGRRYDGHSHVFVEDELWRKLDAKFPDQLNALRVGE